MNTISSFFCIASFGLGLLIAAIWGTVACSPVPVVNDGTTREGMSQEGTITPDASEGMGANQGQWQDGVWYNNQGLEEYNFPPDAGISPDHIWQKAQKPFVQKVVMFSPATAARYGHAQFPRAILGSPRGTGEKSGSLDVVSLGCGGTIVLEFSKPFIGNGPGPDFIVFENAFSYGGAETFAEPAQVSVSIDGKTWHTFPCDPANTRWPHPQCAGIRPVFAHPDNSMSPQDPATSGGDAFDLEDVKLPFARFIKIEDRSHLHPDAKIWCGGENAGFDLDAISVIWEYNP